ncbi:probable inactive heme oxygenase 2, chloroplastic [Dioscorea cayenensis subsp. rotundata]|uniref:Probable inactive heme oxygenase 2, chloroplastic n=1 Tax=Dioscorea cayennensis subsp. rotundata TaxID=55577 RepID=A0AB40D1P0_DIOCR|nr:probable inactive heme oxygenase 2, chloroplastic [Dioscorea cayenensis subsp. rotundata]
MLSFGGASPAPLAYSYSLLSLPPLKILNPNPSSNLLSPNCIPFSGAISSGPPPPVSTVLSKRKRYRKTCPGEAEGIAQEMRFVAMRLRNSQSSTDDDGGDLWQPSLDGFLKYLVDSKLVFDTVERIVDESADVSYAYFRKTGLERSSGLSKDLEWFSQQGPVIPEQSSPGIAYARYLEELAEKSGPSFLCHFYNIYFAHIAGGQVIGKQACEKLSVGKELEFHKWQGDVQELLKDAREKLNKLGEYWTRYEKNRCLREAAKSFKFSGQIVRLIIL